MEFITITLMESNGLIHKNRAKLIMILAIIISNMATTRNGIIR